MDSWIRNLCSGWHAYTLCIKLCTCFMFYSSTWAWLCSRGHIFSYYIPYTWSISPPVSEILKLPLIVYFSEAYIMWEARQDQWGIPEVAGWLAKQWWQSSSSWVCKGKLTSYDLFLSRLWFLNMHRVSTEIRAMFYPVEDIPTFSFLSIAKRLFFFLNLDQFSSDMINCKRKIG